MDSINNSRFTYVYKNTQKGNFLIRINLVQKNDDILKS